MAIRVTYEPYQAIGELAQKAGKAEGAKRAQAIGAQMAMARMQNEAAERRMRFQAEVQQQVEMARMEYQSNLNAQKMAVATQIQLQEFQRKQAKMSSLISQIDEAQYLSPTEKEQMKLSVYSKYADADLSGTFFNQADAIGQKAQEKIKVYQELVSQGVADDVARSAAGLRAEPKSEQEPDTEDLVDRYNELNEQMGLYYDFERDEVIDETGMAMLAAEIQKLGHEIKKRRYQENYQGKTPEEIANEIAVANPEQSKMMKEEIAKLRKQNIPEETIKEMMIQAMVSAPEKKEKKKRPKLWPLMFGLPGLVYNYNDMRTSK